MYLWMNATRIFKNLKHEINLCTSISFSKHVLKCCCGVVETIKFKSSFSLKHCAKNCDEKQSKWLSNPGVGEYLPWSSPSNEINL